ncbi:class I SAM-dependent methyltransferase [Thalassospira povalilytica]|uniref:class I SAM-dependent methyltransferase n=1 Tax=Thalassospira povalilytica TaxID=732237 RepID=UPI001D185F08|nr:class I SAM-dependent methyltransferase [Thalassospira povalilytica]MCC4241945.1 methyltransferase domain-containing protein [Thalassospira povalilytica]
MRADYSAKSDPSLSEQDRLDNHWTENWKKIDNQRRSQWRIKLRPEYKVVRKYAPQPGKGVRVLDGGCGLGEWCILLKDLGYEPYGLDLSTPTVQALRAEFPDMHFVREDIRKTSFEDNFFDLYISWGTFEHFENGLEDCFKEAHRVLKPNGTLIISVPFYNNRLKTIDAENVPSDNDLPEAEKEFYQWRLERDELRNEFEINGFSTQHIEPIYTREGLNRHMHHKYGVPYGRLSRLTALALSPLASADKHAHMLIGVATKR